MTLRALDLFSGIGGFSLGLERAGMKTAAFCEIDPYCRRVLAKHWLGVPIYDDVRTLTAARLAADGIIEAVADNDGTRLEEGDDWRSLPWTQLSTNARIDLICGGFPCQDISTAGKGVGIDGARSGLWSEFARIIGEVRPRYVIVENVAALLGRGLARVLGDLASLGFDAEWHCIPASAVGAPHRRDRVWIIGYAMGDAASARRNGGAIGSISIEEGFSLLGAGSEDVAHNDGAGWTHVSWSPRQTDWRPIVGPNAIRCWSDHWLSEPDVGRVANGVPARVDRLRSLGNAVVPQILELIGHAIIAQQREAAA